MPEQVGWWCSYPGVGWYILCTECGDGRPGEDRSLGHSRPLLMDEIRPQPQTCHRCKAKIVEGILPVLPDRYAR